MVQRYYFADTSFTSATFTANGCLIFNDSATGDPAVSAVALEETKQFLQGHLQFNFQSSNKL